MIIGVSTILMLKKHIYYDAYFRPSAVLLNHMTGTESNDPWNMRIC